MQDLKPLSILWRAVLIGSADVVPGVSGGTMALITGLYARLTRFIADISAIPKKVFSQRSFSSVKQLDWQFGLLLGVGVFVAFGIAAQILPGLLRTYPGFVYALFLGLILATAGTILIQYQKTYVHILTGFVGLFIGISSLAIPQTSVASSQGILFLLGITAGAIMLLPGVSGSYLLVITGHYATLLGALAAPLANASTLALFGLGVFCGVLFAGKIVTFLLERARAHTMLFLSGVMLGSTAQLLVIIQSSIFTPIGWGGVLGLVTGGIILVWLFQKKAVLVAH